MTLGFNFEMALHLPSPHSHHHHSHSHHDSVVAAAAIGIHHPHHHLQQQHDHLQNHNHGYNSSTYPIKYEPCEQQHQNQHHQQHQSSSPTTTNSSSSTSSSSTSSSSSSATVGGGGAATLGMIGTGAHDFLLHQQHISTFDRDFFDQLDSSRMNNHNQQQQQLQHHLQQQQQHHSHHRMLSSGDGSEHHLNGVGGRHLSSIESPLDSEESEDDEEVVAGLNGMNVNRNSMISDEKRRQQHRQLRALGKSTSLNSNNSNSNNLDRKRPYPCKVCPSKFGSKMELEEHQNSHTGQKPFECEVCKSRFNRRSTLWNHKRIHSDAKPFVCTICHMQFKWKNSLKCHKEMHIRKNETPSIGDVDADIRQLTYATAAKRRMLEMDGCGGGESSHSTPLTIFSTGPAVAPSTSSQGNNINNGGSSNNSSCNELSSKTAAQRKRQKLTKKESNSSIKKEIIESSTLTASPTAAAINNNDAQQLNLLMNKAFGTTDFDNNNSQNYQGFCMSNPAMRKLTFGSLAGDFDNTNSQNCNSLMSRDFGVADFNLDHSNFDLMNNPLWMQLWNNEQVESMNHLDFHSNRQHNSLFGGMDDPSKVLTSGIFDLKDTLGLQSPNGNNNNPSNNNNNNNSSSAAAAAANQINMLLPKPVINFDLNTFNSSLHDSVNNQRNHPNLPGINHLGTSFPDYSNHETSSLTSQFHLGQNQATASSSSTPSSSTNGHQQNGHLSSTELAYHQPLDHALLLNTNHSNDYMLPLEYMTPPGNNHSTSIYPPHDLPLCALTSSTSTHDPLEHSPHSSSSRAAMFYHSSLGGDHHPGCISSSQIPTATAAAAVAAQQMR